MSTGKIIGIVIIIAGVIGIIYGIYSVSAANVTYTDPMTNRQVILFEPDFSNYFPIIAGVIGLIAGFFIYRKAK
jgi:uncharacterized membrane protein HdeD (DUF308 family)